MKKVTIIAILMMSALVFTTNAQTDKNSPNKCSGTNGLTLSDIGSVIEAHNKIRTDVGLPKLEWNCDLADLAQEWATRGIFEHRQNNKYGENIFVSSDATVAAAKSVEKWLAESAFWDNSAGTCETGKVCLHYTQLVSRNTTEIGCGINRNASGKWKVLLVCNYNPAGNFSGKAY